MLLPESQLFSFAEWDPERYGIGVKPIDDQHKILLALINQLTKAFKAATRHLRVDGASNSLQLSQRSSRRQSLPTTAGTLAPPGQKPFPVCGPRQFDPNFQRGSTVHAIVEDLVTYTFKYLQAEDHLLETYAYVDRASQAQDHEQFTQEVTFLLKLMEDFAATHDNVWRLLTFLRLWINEHIPRDRKYAPLLIDKGVGA
jgi:hemerythrin